MWGNLLVVFVVAGFLLLFEALLDALSEGAHLVLLLGLQLPQQVSDLCVPDMHPLLVLLPL